MEGEGRMNRWKRKEKGINWREGKNGKMEEEGRIDKWKGKAALIN